MAMRDLICDHVTGHVSHTKLWANIAYATATVVFAHIGWQATPSDGLSMLFFVYLATIGGNQLANTWISSRLKGAAPAAAPEEKK